MAKYGGLESAVEGPTTTNQDLYELAKTNKGWTTYTPIRKVSFIPTADCHIQINKHQTEATDVIPVKANIGWSEDNSQIDRFVVIESGIEYVLGYRY